MIRRTLVSLMLLLAAGTGSGTAVAQTPPPASPVDSATIEAQTRQLAAELRCPVCQGSSIQDSPVELAASMRAIIMEQLQAGRTPEEVKAYFVERYGEWILLAPPAAGFTLLVYVLPWLALATGLGVVVVVVRRWIRRSEMAAAVDAEAALESRG